MTCHIENQDMLTIPENLNLLAVLFVVLRTTDKRNFLTGIAILVSIEFSKTPNDFR